MLRKVFLYFCFAFISVKLQDVKDQNAVPSNQQKAGVVPPPQQQQPSSDGRQRLVENPACKADIAKYCLKHGELFSDTAALECLQNAVYSEDTELQASCSQAVWEYKVELTQNPYFITAVKQYCPNEMNTIPEMKSCTSDLTPGFALSCLMDIKYKIHENTQCFQFLHRVEMLAFTDFQLVAPFVEHCSHVIAELKCGTLTKPTANRGAPHTQGYTLQCLVDKMVNVPTDPALRKIVEGIPEQCKREVMRISEIQMGDFHLDRPLYFACKKDREQFCAEIPSGNVFQCLMEHKDKKEMEPQCLKELSIRAGIMGQDYHLSHPLTKSCVKEMEFYGCVPQAGFERSLNFHLSRVLLCLENALRMKKVDETEKQVREGHPPKLDQNSKPFSADCQHQMFSHRQMMMSEFRMSPEVVMQCRQEINDFCSPLHDLESEGKTLHCLMRLAQDRERGKHVTVDCKNALQTVVKVADVGSNYKVDKVLYASCKLLIEGKCKMDAASETSTLTCLMKHMDGPDMSDDCEQRLIEVQYFIARDWTLDSELFYFCHKEAVERCSALDNWHALKSKNANVDPGPLVLGCLYRAGYDEEKPLSEQCSANLRRVLRERAVRVNLLPEMEEACREALSEFCSANIRPKEEMNCLQEHFEKAPFKDRYPQCYKEVYSFTKMESKDIKLNRLLMQACRPVIHTYCAEVADKEIDYGYVMQCLSEHKGVSEMTPSCSSYVHHFELISLRDYHFSYQFTKACQSDIQQHCSSFGDDKGAIVRCLSEIMFEHQVLGVSKDLKKDCKKQLRVAYLQQEQVDFDDRSHMEDADPELAKKCHNDLRRLKCMEGKEKFEDVVECLRVDFVNLEPDCKSIVFLREKIEALDNTFDDELQQNCKYDIGYFCKNQPNEKVLDCLSRSVVVRRLQKPCQKIVQERMLERARDDRLNPGFLEACSKDAEHYCPEDYRKINDPRYAKQQLGNIIASCLRAKFSQFNGAVHLSPQCKDEVSKVILESEFDIHLDPALYKACRFVINRHCSSTILQRGGNFDNVLECLKADFYTGQIQDADCARQLARRTQESLIDIHLDPGLHEACSLDIQRVCKDTPPGQTRIIMCLIDALQVQQVQMSSQCRTKLMERQKLWNIAHEKYQMSLPQSWREIYTTISNHPERSSILTWLGVIIFILLLVGCFCGRWSKNTYSELKNR